MQKASYLELFANQYPFVSRLKLVKICDAQFKKRVFIPYAKQKAQISSRLDDQFVETFPLPPSLPRCVHQIDGLSSASWQGLNFHLTMSSNRPTNCLNKIETLLTPFS